MKVVIDTNGVLRSIPNKGDYRWLIDAWKKQVFVWVISNEILTEYIEMIAFNYSEQAAEITMKTLLTSPNHLRQESYYKWQLVENDRDDNKFVDCAIASGADYLVTNDGHILDLLKIKDLFPPIPIVTFEQFRRIIKYD